MTRQTGAGSPRAWAGSLRAGAGSPRAAALAVLAACLFVSAAGDARADAVRVAQVNTGLSRDGPGLLLRDILDATPDVGAVVDVLVQVAPDVVVLGGIDWDHEGAALGALRDRLAARGLRLVHMAAPRPNTGVPTGRDIDGDGYRGGSRDAQGFGSYPGRGGLAVLSRWPVGIAEDFTGLLWADLPGSLIAADDPAADIQRLSTTAHAVVEVVPPGAAPFLVGLFDATPPVFDGPEDRNGRRNHDEAALWLAWLDGALGSAPEGPLVIAGTANLDAVDGDGRAEALQALLAHPRLVDPRPASAEAMRRSEAEGGVNAGQRGDPALDTADYDDGAGEAGNLRVDYVLPSRDWTVRGAGVAWPAPRPEGAETWPRHGVVWVDLER